MKENRKRSKTALIIVLCVLAVLTAAALVFTRFGGFGTGDSADPTELTKYAKAVEDISVPDSARVIALGEATHGNADFQELKLEVFRLTVEKYGVRAFALEGDYGGCEQANRYIHGGGGSAAEAAAAIGFAIYRTDQMAELLSYMRQYNETAAPGEELRFYGFDMQRYAYSLGFLIEDCKALGVDVGELEKLMDGEDWSDEYDSEARIKAVETARTELVAKEAAAKTLHYADMLLQNLSLGGADAGYADMRNAYMAQNVQWIAQQEAELGHDRIFISAHNGHVAKWGSADDMGTLLAKELGDAYYVIGTDFCRTRCNLPRPDHSRTYQVFYSHDPLANAAKKAGLDVCWLDFTAIPEDSTLYPFAFDYNFMGSLGEGYFWYMRLLPYSYRIFQPPATLYDSIILVADAGPTVILDSD